MKTKIRYDKKIIRDVNCESIEIPLYHTSVLVFLPHNEKVLGKYWEDIDKDAGGYMQDHMKEHKEVWIRFPGKVYYEYIAHESTHAAAAILEYIGHKHVGGDDEALAYLVGFLSSEIVKLCKKNKVKIYG